MSETFSPYGPRVIGEAAYKAQVEAVRTASDIYGPRVTGTASPHAPPPPVTDLLDGNTQQITTAIEKIGAIAPLQALLAAETAGKTRKGVIAALNARIEALTAPAQVAEPASIADIETALDENPAMLEELLAAEMARVEGPRMAALLKMREVEGLRPAELGGARAAVLEQIDAALALGAE